MKKAIKLSALLLLVSTSIFAATGKVKATQDVVTVQSAAKPMVVAINIQKESAGKSYVTFFDADSNELMTDYLTGKESAAKNYDLSELPFGTYTMAVTSNNQVVKKQLTVFEEYGVKTFMLLQ
ncbi:hypothetical protein [Mucilaginibacter psychrotolerans]|uniref:Por secretion system C-terminal sorting domain-containing protein n=1 Tax=Mucilaginibacter psychrotolerans TaxID=1524096 RepID=A0A4Y8SFV2_9SPHI|nr:hypothetical protein [Mucilaginibacter psychrotolerans]TFF37324.1 hypothetical protein E2R66_12895 [Mucilaginibacter psychrotolerans]